MLKKKNKFSHVKRLTVSKLKPNCPSNAEDKRATVNIVNLAGSRVSSGRLFRPAFSNTGRRGLLSPAGS